MLSFGGRNRPARAAIKVDARRARDARAPVGERAAKVRPRDDVGADSEFQRLPLRAKRERVPLAQRL